MSMKIDVVEPKMGLPGGEVNLIGKGFTPKDNQDINVLFGEEVAWIDAVSNTLIMTTIPDNCSSCEVTVKKETELSSNAYFFKVPQSFVTGLHIVDNLAIDKNENIYVTFSGNRGENTSVSVYNVHNYGNKSVHLKGITNATSLAVDDDGILYVLSRYNGNLYRSYRKDEYELFSQGLGVGFGLAFNSKGELFAGDRTGSIFKIAKDGRASIFGSINQSYIAFHLAFDKDDNLYVTNPVHMGENYIVKFTPDGNKSIFYSGLSLFHGFTFDNNNNMYLAENKRKESRIIKITPQKKTSVVICGSNFIGCTFNSKGDLIVATTTSLYKIDKRDVN